MELYAMIRKSEADTDKQHFNIVSSGQCKSDC